ncbi:MAG: VOC family protein, partial [Sciscionella sp.]
LEVAGQSGEEPTEATQLWLQVRDIAAAAAELAARGAPILREPRTEPWGLNEMWTADPDGRRIVLVEIPADHPLRADVRTAELCSADQGQHHHAHPEVQQ